MKITFQTTIEEEKYILDVEDDMTVGDAKKKIEEMMNEDNRIAAQDQKCIFAGKVLKDDEKFKSIANLSNESCIFLMGKRKSKSAEKCEKPVQESSQPAGGYTGYPGYPQNNPNMGMGNDIFGAGNIQQSFEYLSKNPQIIDMLYGQMMQNMSTEQKDNLRNTILSHIKEFQKDPRSFQQAVDYARNINPASFNQMMGMPMGQSPGGFPNMQPPQQQYAQQQPVPCSHGFYPPYSPHPSPYNSPYNAPGPQQQSSGQSSPNFEHIYEEELVTLKNMGYQNHKLNLEALKKAKGDINLAVQYLIDWSN